ncbi:36_t:CDS:1, partial [Diversispora eburnea]
MNSKLVILLFALFTISFFAEAKALPSFYKRDAEAEADLPMMKRDAEAEADLPMMR